MAIRLIPQSLCDVLDYDPNTGALTWNQLAPRNKGKPAGHVDAETGYRIIGHKGKTYKAHRVAYCIFHGKQPHIIDHINHERDDNRASNLRSVDYSANCLNRTNQGRRVTWRYAKHPHNRYFINAKYRGRHLYKGNDILKAHFRLIMAIRADHPIGIPKL